MTRTAPIDGLNENREQMRFELRRDGHTSFLVYKRAKGKLYLLHTEVPGPLRGGGLGSELVRLVLEKAKEEAVEVVAYCPFVRDFLSRHSEYDTLVAGSN